MSLEDWTVRVEGWHGTARMPRNLDETGEMINCENSTLTLVSRFSCCCCCCWPCRLAIQMSAKHSAGGPIVPCTYSLVGLLGKPQTGEEGSQGNARKRNARTTNSNGTDFGSPSASFPPVSVGKCISVFWNFGILEFLSPSPPLRTFSRSLETAPCRSCELSGKLFLLHPYISHDTVHREFRVTCSPQLSPPGSPFPPFSCSSCFHCKSFTVEEVSPALVDG